jgi:hypothetical protein
MTEQAGQPEQPEPLWPEPTPDEPDAAIADASDDPAIVEDVPPTKDAPAARPDDAHPEEKTKERLEDKDPEPESSDNDAAEVDRQRGMFRLNMLKSNRNQVFQADLIKFYGTEVSSVPRHGPVPAALLRKLNSLYVSPPCEGDLLLALSRSPVQCLVGPKRTGRTTAAIVIAGKYFTSLSPPRPAEGNIHILATAEGLTNIDASSIPEGKALIMAVEEPEIAVFSSIEAILRTRGSILILVTATEPVGPAALKQNWMMSFQPPSPEAVFCRHVGLHWPDQRVAELLALDNVRVSLRQCRSPHDGGVLAARVLTELDERRPDEELLAGLEPTGLLEAANKELRENELWRRNFLIAASVLFELTAGTVTREATRLAELRDPGPENSQIPRAKRFDGPLTEWSQCVELYDDQNADGAGRMVRLTHPQLAEHLLSIVWHDHLGERDVLLAWLLGLGAHPQKRVRVKAAQTAAQLACYDFEVATREVIQMWAADGGFRTRQSSSLALEALAVAAEGRFAERVRGVVRNWAKSGNVQLVAAGVAAYGTFLGANDPDEALARMQDIVGGRIRRWDGRRDSSIEHAEKGLATIVHHAVLAIFDAGAQEKIIQTLASWCRLPHWRWRHAAARSLLDLAGRDGSDDWPLLADLARAQPTVYADVLTLWRNALDPTYHSENGWNALRRWKERADHQRGVSGCAEFTGLIDQLFADLRASDTGIAENLDFHERIWTFRVSKR